MVHFKALFVLVLGGIEVIQPAAAGVLAGLTARNDLVFNYFLSRQTSSGPQVPPQCASTCNPVAPTIAAGNCTPAVCCTTSFETSSFDCLNCTEVAAGETDYSSAQAVIDDVYDSCAGFGIQLPVLTFPGQNPDRPLSSVVQSQTTITTVASQASTSSVVQTTIGPSTSLTTVGPSTSPTTTATSATNTPTQTTSASSGFRIAETNCFNLITGAMMLGTWFYFA